MYSLADGPAGLIVLTSAVVLALVAREILPSHPVTLLVRRAFQWAALSIAAVAAIYFGFAWSIDVGADVRPYGKAVSGVAAGVSAWYGWRVVQHLRR